MLAEIEDAIIAKLKEAMPAVDYADSVSKAADLHGKISYALAVVSGSAEPISMTSVKQTVQISIWVVFKNFRSDSARREGIFPILEGIAQQLFRQKLGLDINPIMYSGFADVSTDEERLARIGVYQINLSTQYEIHKLDDEDAADLLSVGISYYLDGAAEPIVSGEQVTLQES